MAMFDDKRSKKVILVAHCILNQNVKIDRCACYPGTVKEVARVLIDSDIGLLQMPCPELFCLGLDRQAGHGVNTTIESEDTRVAQRMIEDSTRILCREMVDALAYQLDEYRKNGFKIVGVIGINGSPTCGVETTWCNDKEERGSGIFIQMLNEECSDRNIALAMRGIKAYEPNKAVAATEELLKTSVI
jgi:predicted secreted protein